MGKKDPRVDAYIAKSAEFARPILTHIRGVVHDSCPEVEETLKWGTPSFEYKGMLCGMAAFKQHCTFGFWKSPLVLGDGASRDPARQFGRLTEVSELPSRKILAGYIRKAMALNESGVKLTARPRAAKAKSLKVPQDLAAVLKKHPPAREAFASLSPSHRNEYIEWITEAKREDTRQRRLQTAVIWMAEGKSRNWKYER